MADITVHPQTTEPYLSSILRCFSSLLIYRVPAFTNPMSPQLKPPATGNLPRTLPRFRHFISVLVNNALFPIPHGNLSSLLSSW